MVFIFYYFKENRILYAFGKNDNDQIGKINKNYICELPKEIINDKIIKIYGGHQHSMFITGKIK